MRYIYYYIEKIVIEGIDGLKPDKTRFFELVNAYLVYDKQPTKMELLGCFQKLPSLKSKILLEELKRILQYLYTRINKNCQESKTFKDRKK